jgi:hypothetical protein
MKQTRLLALGACVIGVILSSPLWGSPVTVTENDVYNFAYDTIDTSNTDTGTTIPYSNTLSISDGSSSSITTQNYSGNANYAKFAYGFSHEINNTIGDMSTPDYADSFVNYLIFTATSNAPYTIDGSYAMLGPIGTQMSFYVRLEDLTVGSTVFFDWSRSFNTPDESFLLGVSDDGDDYNDTIGSLSGSMIAGHTYRLFYDAYIQAGTSQNVTMVHSSATGEVSLLIGTVPIPPAFWLFGTGLLSLVGMARRNKA